MRLGGFYEVARADELPGLCPRLDENGLSAIPAPAGIAEMSDEECVEFGRVAAELDLVIGESGVWENLLTTDAALQAELIERTRTTLRRADLMGCHCVITMAGTKHDSDELLAPHPYMFTEDAEAELREIVLRILDGLELHTTRLVLEPWCNSFIYGPESIAAFIDSVDDPRFGAHLDLMNMVGRESYFTTTDLVSSVFSLLGPRIAGVHFKDILWDYEHMGLKLDEVPVGDGVIDYESLLLAIDRELPPDTTCFCEHLPDEAGYVASFARLHEIAAGAGLRFHRRQSEG
jgi:sugar phosphate isomerase/epimerase